MVRILSFFLASYAFFLPGRPLALESAEENDFEGPGQTRESLSDLHGRIKSLTAGRFGTRDGAGPNEKRETRGESILAAWKETLAGLDSAREESDFLKRRAVEIKIVPLTDKESAIDTSVALYVESRDGKSTVYVNDFYLDRAVASLTEKGMPPEKAARLVALWMAPIIGHELRHGITHQGAQEAVGRPMIASIQDEIISHLAGARIAAELREKFPELSALALPFIDEGRRELLDAWARGPAGIEDYVRKNYERADLLAPDEELLADALARKQALQGSLERMNIAKDVLASPQSPEALREAATTWLSRSPSEKALRRALAEAENIEYIFHDRGSAEKLRAFARDEQARVGQPR